MKLADTNVLLYAVNSSTKDHAAAKRWLERSLSGEAAVGLSWSVLIGFLRISTLPAAFERPLPLDVALGYVQGWLESPSSYVLQPTVRHAAILGDLLRRAGTAGNLTNDAHLATLAIEHRAEVVTYDIDFGRFPGVRWSRPS